jgi:hypothetical protein
MNEKMMERVISNLCFSIDGNISRNYYPRVNNTYYITTILCSSKYLDNELIFRVAGRNPIVFYPSIYPEETYCNEKMRKIYIPEHSCIVILSGVIFNVTRKEDSNIIIMGSNILIQPIV